MRFSASSTLYSSIFVSLLTASFAKADRAQRIGEDASIPMFGAVPWPAHLKYYPSDHDSHVQRRRDEVIDSIRHGAKPAAVKKMSHDEGEMFWPEYWSFEASPLAVINSTTAQPFSPAFKIHETSLPPHDGKRSTWTNGLRALERLQKRAFNCPEGTSACSSIGEDNYCCGTGQSCFAIQDTGLGPVGCCPEGVSCAGEITTCNMAAGQTACAQNLGGACCVAGFACFDVGCVRVESVVQTITRDVPTVAPPPSTSEVTTTTSTETTTVASENSTPVIVIPPVTSAPSAVPTRDPNAPCNGYSSFTSCPAEIGGCCLSGRQCVAGGLCPLPGETITPLPPVRGTGTTVTTTTSPPSPEPTDEGSCPTGFYACSAYYPGAGCCRIGRDCSSTYCPTTASQTVISGGREVVVPAVGAATSTAAPGSPSSGSAASSCANGWSACPADQGAGCCPAGYECGVEWCSFVAPDARATESVKKEGQTSGALRMRGGWMWMIAVYGVLMVLL